MWSQVSLTGRTASHMQMAQSSAASACVRLAGLSLTFHGLLIPARLALELHHVTLRRLIEAKDSSNFSIELRSCSEPHELHSIVHLNMSGESASFRLCKAMRHKKSTRE